MNKYVADTMAIVLFLEGRKLPLKAKSIFNDAIAENCIINFPAVSLMEIGYLSEKGRIDISLSQVVNFVSNHKNFSVLDLHSSIILRAFQINDIPELHDRLIAATAIYTNAQLITNDPLISASSQTEVVWQ